LSSLSNTISIIIATKDRESQLSSCLQSVKHCDLPPARDVEVIVIDNNSQDGTRRVVEEFAESTKNPAFRYLYEPRQGKSFAVNTGVAAARGSIIAFTDDDVVVDQKWLGSLVEEFSRYQEVGLLAGRVEVADDAGEAVAVTRSLKEKTLESHESLDGLILGCNLAVRREVLKRVSGRDTRLGPGRGLSCEDIDFVYRVLRADIRGRFSPNPLVFHAPGLRNRSKEYLRGWGAFYLKYLLYGDRHVARKFWWEFRRILRDFRSSPSSSSLNEMLQMLIGALIMAKRMTVSLFHRHSAEVSLG
jgi:glycosyltransferase involved in cell wall biosynthesis